MREDQSQMAQLAWDAVERFVAGVDPQATTTLYRLLHDSAEEAGVHVLSLPAPQLLQHALNTPSDSSSARLLVIALLNHLFCTRLLPLTLQRPADRKATGLDELESLYLAVIQTCTLAPAVERQLIPCAATLLLLNHASALTVARAQLLGDVDGDGLPTQLVSALQRQRYAALFVSLCDILTDRRVPLGPVQRARQLRDLQQSLAMLLSVTFTCASAPSAAPVSSSPSLDEQPLIQGLVRALGRGAAVLLERASDEPLDVCPDFWQRLPSHPLWQVCLGGVHVGDPEAVETVCHVLRCLTVMEPASEQLLSSALTAALQTGHLRSSYEIITAALEASTEAVILGYDPSHPLFQLLSRSAERLLAPLQDGVSDNSADCGDRAECALLACEGVAVLAQTLTPFPIPEMEPSDDPEDYAAIVEEMQAGNANKARVLDVLREFFVVAQRLFFLRLVTRTAATEQDGEDDDEGIARYLAQCLEDGDDSAVVFEDTSVAYYSCYERLRALLGGLPAEAISALQDGRATLTIVGCDARALLWFLQHHLACTLPSTHAASGATGLALLPVLVRRFTAPHSCFGGASAALWSRDDVSSIAEPLVAQLHVACSGAPMLAPARYLMDTAGVLLDSDGGEPTPLAQATLGTLPQQAFPLVWLGLSQVGQSVKTLPASARHHSQLIAERLGEWVLRGLCRVPSLEGFVAEAVTLAPPFRVEMLSALPATSAADIATVLDLIPPTLQWMGEAHHEATLHRLGQRLTSHVGRLLANGGADGATVSEMLRQYARKLPALCPVLLMIVTQVDALPDASETALECVSRAIWSLGTPADVATSDLGWMLSERVCTLLACAASLDVVQGLLQALVQPSASFTTSSGVHRLHLIARLGRLLVESGRAAPQVLLACYADALQRLLECISAVSLGGFASASHSAPAVRGGGADAEEERETASTNDMFQELAAFARCTAGTWTETAALVAPTMNACLTRLGRCEDDFERLAVLKEFVQ